jgi:hypothetical protein
MALTPSGRYVVRSVSLEPAQDAWLKERAKRLSVDSVSVIVRQAINAARDAEAARAEQADQGQERVA